MAKQYESSYYSNTPRNQRPPYLSTVASTALPHSTEFYPSESAGTPGMLSIINDSVTESRSTDLQPTAVSYQAVATDRGTDAQSSLPSNRELATYDITTPPDSRSSSRDIPNLFLTTTDPFAPAAGRGVAVAPGGWPMPAAPGGETATASTMATAPAVSTKPAPPDRAMGQGGSPMTSTGTASVAWAPGRSMMSTVTSMDEPQSPTIEALIRVGVSYTVFENEIISPSPVDTSAQCGICMGYDLHAVLAGCGHHHLFCLSCILNWISRHPSCPKCHSVIMRSTLTLPSPNVRSYMQAMTVSCSYCLPKWCGSFSSLPDHRRSCTGREHSCQFRSLGCDLTMRSEQEMQAHDDSYLPSHLAMVMSELDHHRQVASERDKEITALKQQMDRMSKSLEERGASSAAASAPSYVGEYPRVFALGRAATGVARDQMRKLPMIEEFDFANGRWIPKASIPLALICWRFFSAAEARHETESFLFFGGGAAWRMDSKATPDAGGSDTSGSHSMRKLKPITLNRMFAFPISSSATIQLPSLSVGRLWPAFCFSKGMFLVIGGHSLHVPKDAADARSLGGAQFRPVVSMEYLTLNKLEKTKPLQTSQGWILSPLPSFVARIIDAVCVNDLLYVLYELRGVNAASWDAPMAASEGPSSWQESSSSSITMETLLWDIWNVGGFEEAETTPQAKTTKGTATQEEDDDSATSSKLCPCFGSSPKPSKTPPAEKYSDLMLADDTGSPKESDAAKDPSAVESRLRGTNASEFGAEVSTAAESRSDSARERPRRKTPTRGIASLALSRLGQAADKTKWQIVDLEPCEEILQMSLIGTALSILCSSDAKDYRSDKIFPQIYSPEFTQFVRVEEAEAARLKWSFALNRECLCLADKGTQPSSLLSQVDGRGLKTLACWSASLS